MHRSLKLSQRLSDVGSVSFGLTSRLTSSLAIGEDVACGMQVRDQGLRQVAE